MYLDFVVSLRTGRGSDVHDTQYKTSMVSGVIKTWALKLDVLCFYNVNGSFFYLHYLT